MQKRLKINAGNGYEIVLERGALKRAGELAREVSSARRAAVITDSNVAALLGDAAAGSFRAAGFETPMFTFPAGESSKSHETLLGIYSFLAREHITRGDLIVALGGGVTGDMAGFAAATFLRGVPFVQLPTTLLAQIDSSVGGKTAVDLPEGKNLVGAFYQPALVVCDPDALRTLPPRVFSDGMAEAVKYGCISDRALFGRIAAFDGQNGLEEIIARCVEIKRDVVERDEFDRGDRMLLNFGHTLGHAVEQAGHYREFTHGEAVAVGMLLAARAGERRGLTRPGTGERIADVLRRLRLPETCPYPPETLLSAAAGDKKRAGGEITVVLLREIGEGFLHKIPVSGLGALFFGN